MRLYNVALSNDNSWHAVDSDLEFAGIFVCSGDGCQTDNAANYRVGEGISACVTEILDRLTIHGEVRPKLTCLSWS